MQKSCLPTLVCPVEFPDQLFQIPSVFRQVGITLGQVMPTVFTQDWFADVFLSLVSLALSVFSAFEVSRRGWFRVRPVLSTYAWFLAIMIFLLLAVFLLQIPEAIRYTACRAYSLIYNATGILMCLLAVAVVYEFLFRMAGTRKTIQRTAIAGFIITISLTSIAAVRIMGQLPSNSLQNVSRLMTAVTPLALMASGLFVFAVKKTHSLFLETRLSIFLAALALCSFLELLMDFMLRRAQHIRLVVDDAIWFTFAILLYRALKSGPTIPRPATENSAGFAP